VKEREFAFFSCEMMKIANFTSFYADADGLFFNQGGNDGIFTKYKNGAKVSFSFERLGATIGKAD
jgi:hypothetical protein